MKRRKRTPPRRRNVYAALVRRYGHRIEASAKAYKRRPKHRNPRQPHDGGFDLGCEIRADRRIGWRLARRIQRK